MLNIDTIPTIKALRNAQRMRDHAIGFFSTNQIRMRRPILSVVDMGDAWLVTPAHKPTCALFAPFELIKATLQPYLKHTH